MPRLARPGFVARLLLSVAVALAVAGGATYAFITRDLVQAVDRSHLQELRESVVQTKRMTGTADELTQLEAIVNDVARDPQVVAAGVVDVRANPLFTYAFLDDSARRLGVQALRSGRGQLVTAVRAEGLEVQQLATPMGDYAVVAEVRPRSVEPLLAAVRSSLLRVGVPALLLVLALVWLVGGRALARAHGVALQRATRDGLTDLGNHRAFQDELLHATATSARTGDEVGLLLVDLDDFKRLNDEQGHEAGDALLKAVAAALSGCCRVEDRAFRIGGDEFAVLLPRAGEADAAVVGLRVHDAIERTGARCSIGAGATRPGMHDGVQLRDEVDAAAYEAKARQAGGVVRVSEIADAVASRDRGKAEALFAAVQDDDVEIAFQPIWDMEAGRIVGVEALARLDPATGIAGPAEAFEIAERAGFGARLDRVCARRALAEAATLPEGVLLFLNLTAATLSAEVEGSPWVAAEAALAGLPPERVVVEVSERFGRRPGAVVRGAAELRRLGFRLALDDVGAGEAGLTRLRALDLDFVKVDRGVVAAAATERGARAVLTAVAAYARASGAFVIAEGIEDAETLETVRQLALPSLPADLGIRGGQGFALAQPCGSLAEALAAEPGVRLGGTVRRCSPSTASTT